jgi:hypothetical protein
LAWGRCVRWRHRLIQPNRRRESKLARVPPVLGLAYSFWPRISTGGAGAPCQGCWPETSLHSSTRNRAMFRAEGACNGRAPTCFAEGDRIRVSPLRLKNKLNRLGQKSA